MQHAGKLAVFKIIPVLPNEVQAGFIPFGFDGPLRGEMECGGTREALQQFLSSTGHALRLLRTHVSFAKLEEVLRFFRSLIAIFEK